MDLQDSAPGRPPPPRSYSPGAAKKKSKKRSGGAQSDYSCDSTTSTLRLPKPLKPPKLQHVLIKKRHDLVKAGPRDDGILRAPDFDSDTDDYDYDTVRPESVIPEPSDEELEEVDAGETPRGDKSMIIKTEHGDLKSKYHYLGFGLWENTEPADPKPPPPKPSPPSPPPKAEPVWYNCSVSVESHKTSKELDDLVHALDGFDRMAKRDVEVGNAAANLPGCLGDLYEEFEKEDMSDMFRRAMLEKMALMDDDNRLKYKCYVCSEWIRGRIITAMGHKFHPECFVCTYCRQEFKERSFKSDDEGKPYCYECFEKLLGHFGTARFKIKELA